MLVGMDGGVPRGLERGTGGHGLSRRKARGDEEQLFVLVVLLWIVGPWEGWDGCS